MKWNALAGDTIEHHYLKHEVAFLRHAVSETKIIHRIGHWVGGEGFVGPIDAHSNAVRPRRFCTSIAHVKSQIAFMVGG